MEFSWKRTIVQSLIDLYEQHECLYNVRSKNYMNRDIKASAWNSILEGMRQICPTILLDIIKKKVKGLRSQFSSELRTVQNRRKSGMGTDEEYEPKLWCFKQLSFLKNHLSMRGSVSNTDDLSASLIEDCSESETPTKKKPRKRSLEDGLEELQSVLENKNKNKSKYEWLGKKVLSVLAEIEDEEQINAVWEIESVLNKYWRKTIKKKQEDSNIENSSQQSTTLSSCSLSPSAVSPHDILQLSMEGLFDNEDETW